MVTTKFKVMSYLLAITMVLSVFAILQITASAKAVDTNNSVSTKSSGNYNYEILEDGTAEITGYTGSQTNITISSTLGGYTVTSIGKHAFQNCSGLELVAIGDSVKRIGNWAFYNCESLESVTIGQSIESIGKCAFGYNFGEIK